MGLEVEKTENNDASARLIAAGRAVLARGDAKFPLTRLCAEAGVTLADFRNSFASKAALLQQLMEAQKPEPAPAPVADAWLERRLRVFERALNGLEEKAETRERENRLALARLEERLASLSGTTLKLEVANAAQTVSPASSQPVPEEKLEAAAPEPAVDMAPKTEAVLLAPLEPAPVARADADFMEAARQAALAHGRQLERKPEPRRLSGRVVAVAIMAVLVLALCAGLTLVHAAYTPVQAHEGTMHRLAANTPLARLAAKADSGDAKAQTQLALAYLHGDGLPKDAAAAARWAQAAASGGDVKGMHALAVAYAMGQGVPQDGAQAVTWFTRAAARGYVDSAFDLAVLYERGEGVPQDARAALRWYQVAAQAGDAQAAARAQILKEQANL